MNARSNMAGHELGMICDSMPATMVQDVELPCVDSSRKSTDVQEDRVQKPAPYSLHPSTHLVCLSTFPVWPGLATALGGLVVVYASDPEHFSYKRLGKILEGWKGGVLRLRWRLL